MAANPLLGATDVQRNATLFEPTEEQERYLLAYIDALDQHGQTGDTSLAAKLGVDRSTIWRWRQRDAGFREWIRDEVRRLAGDKGAAVLDRCANLAIRGSAKHAELFFRVTGELTPEDGHTGQPIVTVNVVNIPEQVKDMNKWVGGYLPDTQPRPRDGGA